MLKRGNTLRKFNDEDINFLPLLINLDLFNLIRNNIHIFDHAVSEINKLNINDNATENKIKLELLLNNLRTVYDMGTIESFFNNIKTAIITNKQLFNYLLLKKQLDIKNTFIENIEKTNNQLLRFAININTRFEDMELDDDIGIMSIDLSYLEDKGNFDNYTVMLPKTKILLIGYNGNVKSMYKNIKEDDNIVYTKLLTYISYYYYINKLAITFNDKIDILKRKLYNDYVRFFV